MSELRVDSVKSKGGGAPNLPKGVTISGITTAATLGATTVDVSNVNVSGVVTSGTLNGELLSTGTPTLGLGVTINSSGLVISGVATAGIVSATTLYGDGSNLTGIAATLAPLFYNPDPYDTAVTVDSGIGITFNQQVKAGTGNVTLSIANAGVAGTVVENFGVGSSVSISENRITINPTADLSGGLAQYFISYPSGAFTNNEGTDYVGTGYTFETKQWNYNLWTFGSNGYGQRGNNNIISYSSPVQIPGTNWKTVDSFYKSMSAMAFKTDGTLWNWGYQEHGSIGNDSQTTDYSSPVQIPGTTWSVGSLGTNLDELNSGAIKTDGTLWMWGSNSQGQLGHNNRTYLSSPVQLGSDTNWCYVMTANHTGSIATKTDGTLWAWGRSPSGELGLNDTGAPSGKSSPTQIPGTTWDTSASGYKFSGSEFNTTILKTDGTLWVWGSNTNGELGQNNRTQYSSPVQIPGTTWDGVAASRYTQFGTKTDGTLWAWGSNGDGGLGQAAQGNRLHRSSPVQIPGTTWKYVVSGYQFAAAVKTDGTAWAWGRGGEGQLGQNNRASLSSPTQVGSGTDWDRIGSTSYGVYLINKT